VVIQGGAGSGKTTIGLHRIAYLTYAFPERFPPRRILVVTQGPALAAYISQVLPALGVQGVMVTTMADWAAKQMHDALPLVRFELAEDVPAAVSRLKFHPAVLHDLERRVREHLARPVAKGRKNTRAMLELWGDLLTDRNRLASLVRGDDALGLGEHELDEALRFIAERVTAVLDRDPAERRERRKKDDEPPEDDDIRGATGIDGVRTVEDRVLLDEADLALLLRTHQLMRGGKQELAHLFVDEAQDLSPLELAVLIGQTSEQRSVTLAGDTAQRLFLDNGFGDWRSVLRHLSLDHVAIEPLRIAYRSTREILALARHVMGPLADAEPPQAPRTGAPVEVHTFPGVGAAVAFCAEALRPLLAREPRATVAVIARHPEQADRYYEGLRRADVPALRRVRAQDFAFRPGIEVTDVRQVKGLEFDYVLLVDVNANVYGRDDEARHLLHIGATRAAHQLWLIVTGTPSPLLP
jgi:DNA helicase II / ATP-dependent DNA helicase PcrA